MLTIRRDDDHVDTHDPDLYFTPEPFAHEAPLMEHVMGRVLDVGCGAGRTLLWLERRRVDAVGIDVSPGAVEVASARGCSDVRLGDVMDQDDGILRRDAFGTAIVFGNNLGIGGTYNGAERLLRRLARTVVPGGRLLITGLDVAKTEQQHHLAYHRRNMDEGRPRGEIKMRFEYEGLVGDWVRWFHPEPNELGRLAEATGWTVETIGPAGEPFYAWVLQNAR